jgi:hypothetical protein
MKRITQLIVAVLLILLSGCGWVEKCYTYHQSDSPVGTFTVHLKIGPKQNLVMLEDFEQKGVGKSTTIRAYFDGCQYFDEANWTCQGAAGFERAEMAHGKFTHYYWSSVRSYTATYRPSFLN